MLIPWLKKSWITNPKLLNWVLSIQNSAYRFILDYLKPRLITSVCPLYLSCWRNLWMPHLRSSISRPLRPHNVFLPMLGTLECWIRNVLSCLSIFIFGPIVRLFLCPQKLSTSGLGWYICVLAYFKWFLDHVIYLKLRREYLNNL